MGTPHMITSASPTAMTSTAAPAPRSSMTGPGAIVVVVWATTAVCHGQAVRSTEGLKATKAITSLNTDPYQRAPGFPGMLHWAWNGYQAKLQAIQPHPATVPVPAGPPALTIRCGTLDHGDGLDACGAAAEEAKGVLLDRLGAGWSGAQPGAGEATRLRPPGEQAIGRRCRPPAHLHDRHAAEASGPRAGSGDAELRLDLVDVPLQRVLLSERLVELLLHASEVQPGRRLRVVGANRLPQHLDESVLQVLLGRHVKPVPCVRREDPVPEFETMLVPLLARLQAELASVDDTRRAHGVAVVRGLVEVVRGPEVHGAEPGPAVLRHQVGMLDEARGVRHELPGPAPFAERLVVGFPGELYETATVIRHVRFARAMPDLGLEPQRDGLVTDLRQEHGRAIHRRDVSLQHRLVAAVDQLLRPREVQAWHGLRERRRIHVPDPSSRPHARRDLRSCGATLRRRGGASG